MKRTLITSCIAVGVIALAIASVRTHVSTPSAFTDFQAAACDQYHPDECGGGGGVIPPVIPPVVPPATTATNTVVDTPTTSGTTRTPGNGAGVAGADTQGGRVGEVHVAANAETAKKALKGQLPFTGFSLAALVLLAVALAALGLLLRAGERAVEARRRRMTA